VNSWRQKPISFEKRSTLGEEKSASVQMGRANRIEPMEQRTQKPKGAKAEGQLKSGQSVPPQSTPQLDWQTSLQNLYSRKSAERPLKEGDPRRFRTVAAELAQAQTAKNVIPSTHYAHWRQVVGDVFLEHAVVRGDESTQRVAVVLARVAWEIIQQYDIETAYTFLALAVRSTMTQDPWEEMVEIRVRDLFDLNIWDPDQELSHGKRLRHLGNLVEMVCNLFLLINQVDPETHTFKALKVPLWVLEELEYEGMITETVDTEPMPVSIYQPEEPQNLTIRVGMAYWSAYFPDVSDYRRRSSLRLYGQMAQGTLQINPYKKPLAAKLSMFLTLTSQLKTGDRYVVGHLLEQIESKSVLMEMDRRKDRRNYLFSRWNTALRTLSKLGWTVLFDVETYPLELQPAWHQANPVQIDLSTADESWLERWLQAEVTILSPVFQELQEADLPLSERFTGRILAEALAIRGLSRSKLAEYLNLDRSMVTYWIKGARLIQPKHREQICGLLRDELEQVLQRA
jgi:hypothetical protein